jgi:hypothetical protein
MSKALSNLAKQRAFNLSNGLKIVIQELQHSSPDSPLHIGRGKGTDYDPAGLIETIHSRLGCLDEDVRLKGSLLNEQPDLKQLSSGQFDHKPLVFFLKNALEAVEAKGSRGIVEFMRFYESFRGQLWKMRGTYSKHGLPQSML